MSTLVNIKKSAAIAALAATMALGSVANAGGHKSAAPANPDIVDTAVAAGDFTTLVTAAKAAGLVEALKGDGPLTVFAPNDAAFGKLWKGTVDNMLKPENREILKALLLYHVVSGKVMSGDLRGTTNAPTLQGGELEIIVSYSGVTVNGAKVIAADIEASNGVIHVIDTVLLPQLSQ